MSEVFSNYEHDNSKEIKTISVFEDARNIIDDETKSFYLKNKDNPETIKSLRDFLDIQKQERGEVDRKYEGLRAELKLEFKNKFEDGEKLNKVQDIIYSKLEINPKLELNNNK